MPTMCNILTPRKPCLDLEEPWHHPLAWKPKSEKDEFSTPKNKTLAPKLKTLSATNI